jgi:hypothetical protein
VQNYVISTSNVINVVSFGFMIHFWNYQLGIQLNDRHVRHLRSRCETLGISHPNMLDDPKEWLKFTKKSRKESQKYSQRKTQFVKSALYGK